MTASIYCYDYCTGPYYVKFPAGVTTASFRIWIDDHNDPNLDLINETFILAINDLLLPKSITQGSFDRATVIIVSDESKCIIPSYCSID